MRGYYNIYEDGQLVRVAQNNITVAGRRVLLRYLAGHVGRFVGAIAVGTSETLPTVDDNRLGFEFGRAPVNLSTPDFLNERLVFKATLDPALAGYIHELGMYPFMQEPATDYNSRLITGFEPSLETFVGGTANAVNYRIGQESLSLTAATNTTASSTLPSTLFDYSGFGADDTFSLALFVNDANVSAVQVRMITDSTNHYRHNFNTSGLGYQVHTLRKGTFIPTGNPDWGNITSISFYVTSTTTGPTTVQLDGIRINDNSDYTDYALISRAVIGTPYYKEAGKQLDIEYVLEVNA